MSRAIRSFLVLFSLSFAMPFPAIGQTYYKCKTPSGGTIFSDAPCASGTRQEQVAPGPSPDRQYAASEAPTSQRSSDTRALDAKVAEALGTGDLPRAKRLAVTPEQMIY